MRFKRFSSSIALCVSLLFGFALWPPPSGIGAETPAFNAGREKSLPDESGRETVDKDGVLTLQQAVSLALAHNPELKASSWGCAPWKVAYSRPGAFPTLKLQWRRRTSAVPVP